MLAITPGKIFTTCLKPLIPLLKNGFLGILPSSLSGKFVSLLFDGCEGYMTCLALPMYGKIAFVIGSEGMVRLLRNVFQKYWQQVYKSSHIVVGK